MRTIQRSELKSAPYNPREVDESAKRKLRSSIKRVGLVQPIVWNKRTGNVVAGHQRLAALDAIEHNTDYALDVAVIDVTPKSEKEINVALNNELLMGTFDIEKLDRLFTGDDIDFENCGFERFELATLLPSFEEPMSPALSDATEAVEETMEEIEKRKEAGRALKRKIKEQVAARGQEREPDVDSMDLFVVLVFPNQEKSDKFLEYMNLPKAERFISGMTVWDLVREAREKAEAKKK